ncbi:hypothetical protein OR1_00226 [Geobacter sp. OR-1]|uniref:SphA family protein n=1 Tax=Geobacter sp. OR-1 TaxID=1266765 RepID=UPI0005434186|nr:transporter [Geobacter sp. OR-1]GAM07957.1 hypothetical protein OR1_00226 [Geobacter sp. OR-1]
MMRRFFRMAAIMSGSIMLLGLLVTGAMATEGGGGAYPNGAEDFMAGAVPPPGTYFLDYFNWYSADRLNNNDGKSSNPDFKLNVTANVFRFLHVTDKTVLGANWGMQMFVPILNVDATVTTPGGKISQSKFGLGDIIIDPVILSWHFSKNLHAVFGLDIFLPTGDYDKTRIVNPGRNYYTFEPIIGATYVCDKGYELSGKFMYDMNTKNSATNYESGNEFHVDYTFAKHIGPWSLGAGGYYYQQVTDDELNGNKIDNSRGYALAIGPQAKYDYKNMSLDLKYQFEVETANRPQGNSLWAKFVYIF